MPEPKGADTDRMETVTAAAVMPCVGGFIFMLAKAASKTARILKIGMPAQ